MKKISAALIILIFISLMGCKNPSPKPRVYFRIDLPGKEYIPYQGDCPYHFYYPEYAMITPGSPEHKCWLNIYFPLNNAVIYLTYKNVNDNIKKHIEDSRNLVYKHTVKANAINEKVYTNDSTQVYGILYDIKGNTASSLQFFITDSVQHFLRGSLYFNHAPNIDSIRPVLQFIRKDIIKLMETTTWQD